MLAATAWDEGSWRGDGHGWTVMGRLRERERLHRRNAVAASDSLRMMTATSRLDYEELMRSRPAGAPTVLAFLFAQPGSQAISALDSSGAYLDLRSGDTWDLFFPGYYKSHDPDRERRTGARPVGSDFAKGWFFRERDFDDLRRHVEEASARRWRYSGLTDLVLVCAWLTSGSEPEIDWDSTISGSVTDAHGPQTLTLNEIIERISQDLETDAEDANFGVREVTDPDTLKRDHNTGRELVIGILSSILADIGERALDT